MTFLNESKLLSDAQSGFRPSDSCECQLLSIAHDIYNSFDCNPCLEVGEILDISKSSDIFYYDGLIYKIKSFGISYITVKLTENFFSSKC